MKPETKKWLIVGGLSVISISLGLLYLQYRRLMDFTIKIKGITVNSLTQQVINFDLFINFTNNSDLKFEIIEQDTKVYINDKFVTRLANYNKVLVKPKETSVIPINVVFNPNDVLKIVGTSAVAMLLRPETVNIKLDIKMKVKLYGITVSIPYVYMATLKDIIAFKKGLK